MTSRPGAGRRRRLLLAAVLAIAVAYAAYLGAANWFLASETGDRVINRKPEKLRIEWSRARSWFPGVVVLDDVTIAGASRAFDWTASLDHVRVALSLWRLPLKTFHSQQIVGRGLVFRLRQHDVSVEVPTVQRDSPLAVATPGSAVPGQAPPGPATADPSPPDSAPTAPAPVPGGSRRRKPWHLELDGISIADVREISIGRSSLIGRGEISGGLDFTVRGPLRFDVLSLAFIEAKLLRDGETLGENVAFTLEASSSPFEPGKDPVREILGGVSGSATVTADVESIAALEFLLKKPEWLSFSGSGHLESEFELDDGVVAPGGRLDFAAETLAARIADWTVEGGGAIALRLPEEGPQAAVLGVDFEQFAIRRGEREVAHVHGEDLRVALEARAFDLERGLEDLDVRIDVPPSRVDFAAYDSYLPKSPFHIEGGNGTLTSWFEYSEADGAGRGEVDLAVEAASAIAGSLGFGGDLRLHTMIKSGDLETRRFDVSGSSLELRNVRVTKRSGEVESEDWWATFATGSARLDMKEPLEAEVVVNGRMRDAKPFLLALAAQKKALFWIDELLNAKDIEGRATIDVDGPTLAARDLVINGRKLAIVGDVAVQGKARDVLLFIEYGPLSTGLEIRDGEREWKLFRARRWFEMRRSARRGES